MSTTISPTNLNSKKHFLEGLKWAPVKRASAEYLGLMDPADNIPDGVPSGYYANSIANTSGSSPSNMNSLDLEALRSVDLSRYLSNDASGMVPIEVPKLQDDFKNVGPRVTSSSAVAGGLGSYGTYNGVGINQDAFNAINGTDHGGTLTQNPNTQNSNTPSTMENVLGYTTAAVGLGGLAGSLYFNQKNLDMQNDWNDYQKNRNAQADARKSSFASKVGGSY